MKVKIDKKRCKQCGLCEDNCPKKAISFEPDFNEFGYRPVVVDQEACIGCGICYTMCPDYVFEVL